MKEEYYEFRSYTRGLWSRFLIRIIAGWIGILLLILYLFPLEIFQNAFFLPIILLVLFGVTSYQFIHHPLKWKKMVLFDFKEQSIFVFNKKSKATNSSLGGIRFPFRDIDSYTIIHYDSVVQSSFFLIKLRVKGDEVSLLSLQHPFQLQEVVALLKDRLRLPVH